MFRIYFYFAVQFEWVVWWFIGTEESRWWDWLIGTVHASQLELVVWALLSLHRSITFTLVLLCHIFILTKYIPILLALELRITAPFRVIFLSFLLLLSQLLFRLSSSLSLASTRSAIFLVFYSSWASAWHWNPFNQNAERLYQYEYLCKFGQWMISTILYVQ